MPRVVSADHVLFKECIFYLREDFYQQNLRRKVGGDRESFSCISTTFHISKPWEFEKFTIYPSAGFILPGANQSLLSLVKNPCWIKDSAFNRPLLFGEVLSAIVSFVTLRSAKSPRNCYRLNVEASNTISPDDIEDIVLTLPFLSAGPGAHNSRLEEATEDQFIREIQEVITYLEKLDKDLYVFILEVMRLVQLSLLVKRDDFGLAYLLLISAIEAVAQKTNDKQKSKKHDKEPEWEEKALTDPSFKELLGEYKKLRGKDTLTNMFIRFILKYSPPQEWEEIVSDTLPSMDLSWDAHTHGISHPSQMEKKQIEEILKNAYIYRSKFVHQGKQPPHQSPTAALNKFFEVIETYNEKKNIFESEVCPTYELMLGIAKNSIFKWLRIKAN